MPSRRSTFSTPSSVRLAEWPFSSTRKSPVVLFLPSPSSISSPFTSFGMMRSIM